MKVQIRFFGLGAITFSALLAAACGNEVGAGSDGRVSFNHDAMLAIDAATTNVIDAATTNVIDAATDRIDAIVPNEDGAMNGSDSDANQSIDANSSHDASIHRDATARSDARGSSNDAANDLDAASSIDGNLPVDAAPDADTSAPDVYLTWTPSDPSGDPNPSFGFESDDPTATFICSIDGLVQPTVCSSGWSPPSALVSAQYLFSVVAIDPAGNYSDPATYQWTYVAPVCGNGIVETGEQCDDGNDIDHDSCSNACTLPPTQSLPFGIADMAVSDDGSLSAISTDQIACVGTDFNLKARTTISPPANEAGYLSVIRLARGRTSNTSIVFSKYVESDNSANYYLQYFDASCTAVGGQQLVADLGNSDSFADIDADATGRVAIVGHSFDNETLYLKTFGVTGKPMDTFAFDTGSYGWGTHVRINPLDSRGVMTYQRHESDPVSYRRFDLKAGVLLDADPTTCGDPTSLTCLTDVTGLISDEDYDSSWYDSHAVAMNSDDSFAIVQVGTQSGTIKGHFYDETAQPVASKILGFTAAQYTWDMFRGVPVRIQTIGTDYLLPWEMFSDLDRVTRFDESGDREGADAISAEAGMQTLALDAAINTYRFRGNQIYKNDVPLPTTDLVADPKLSISVAINGNIQVPPENISLNFGSVLVGDVLAPMVVTFTNNGTLPITVTGVSGDPGIFEITTLATGLTIAAGTSVDVSITLPTTTAQSDYTTLTVNVDNDYYGTYLINLYGNVLNPATANYDYSADWDVDDHGDLFSVGYNYNANNRFALVRCSGASGTTSALGALVPPNASVSPLFVRTSRSTGASIALYAQGGMPDSGDNGLWYQFYDTSCATTSAYIKLSNSTDASQVDVIADANGDFVLTYWDSSTQKLVVQRLASTGATVSTLSDSAPVSNEPLHIDISPNGTVGIVSTEGGDGPTYARRFDPQHATWIDNQFVVDTTQAANENAHFAGVQDDGSFVIMSSSSSTSLVTARFYDPAANFLSQSTLAHYVTNSWSMYETFYSHQYRFMHAGADFIVPATPPSIGTGPYDYGMSFLYQATILERFNTCGTLIGTVTSSTASTNMRLDDAGNVFEWQGYTYQSPTENQDSLPAPSGNGTASCH